MESHVYIIIGIILILAIVLGFSVYKMYMLVHKQKLYEQYILETEKYIEATDKYKQRLAEYVKVTEKKFNSMQGEDKKLQQEIQNIKNELGKAS